MVRLSLVALSHDSYVVTDRDATRVARIVRAVDGCHRIIDASRLAASGTFASAYDAFMAIQAQVDPSVYVVSDEVNLAVKARNIRPAALAAPDTRLDDGAGISA